MVNVLKAMLVLAEKYIGYVDTVSLSRKEPNREYTHDSIRICGKINQRGYELELRLDD